ncbi:uncharacterized protein LOC125526587 [Triticum urartu]|uniref:uncharacterized protein LOC125526587 n=1 Tax=Triticum urartu TaxID=4572 RepID=UPI002044883D|nr:uncharacterized protein LOC125526587 [Triticum urartu]
MFPPAGGVGAGAGAGAWQLQQGTGVRAVAAADVVLGLATAAFALYAVALNPADSLPQTDTALRSANCGATPQQELGMRFEGLVVLLTAAAQAATAGAAWVIATAFGRGMARLLAIFAHALGGFNAYALYYVVRGVAAVTLGLCMGNADRVILVLYHAIFLVTQAVLLVVGFVAVLCGV